MKQYLLDTNIIVFLFKNKFNIATKIDSIGWKNIFISEITLIELQYGALKSNRSAHHLAILQAFTEQIEILPIYSAIDVYVKERIRLEKLGTRVDDFDLLIGSTAITNNLIMITNNITHLGRIEGIIIEDWTKSL